MKNELLEEFKVEELEKRFEMGWVDSVKVGVQYENVKASVVIPLNK